MAEIENIFEFRSFGKIARLSREVIVTEKIDGTNAQILIVKSSERMERVRKGGISPVAIFHGDSEDPEAVDVYAGSRNRWLTCENDNFGFAGWVARNAEELKKLGVGRHYGEWWGQGIQRNYGLKEKRFSLFNRSRWASVTQDPIVPGVFMTPDANGLLPAEQKFQHVGCCHVVPTIWRGDFDTQDIDRFIEMLNIEGSFAAPGFKNPEGLVVYHTAANRFFKKTCVGDEKRKSDVRNPSGDFNRVAQ